MRHSHKAVLAGVFSCLTGCSDLPELVPLTEAQKDDLEEMMKANEASLPIYGELMKRADKTISAKGDNSLKEFTKDTQAAHNLAKRYLKEGRIYGFDENEKVNGRDVAAFFHIDLLEENQYMGISLYTDEETGERKVGITPSVLLHEGGHDEMGEHSDEAQDLAEKEAKDTSYASDFAKAVKTKEDFCYALTILGDTTDRLYWERKDLIEIEALMFYGEKLSTSEGAEAEAAQMNLERTYLEVKEAPILQDQETWARLTIEGDLQSPGLEEKFNALGITREELIYVYATEKNIYSEYRAEYEEALDEFLEKYGDYLEENREGAEGNEGDETNASSEKRNEQTRERYSQYPKIR